MMFDYVFVTHQPAFYKCNLYSELAKKIKIKVIFISSGSSIRQSDFNSNSFDFECVFLSKGSYEERNLLHSLWSLAKEIRATTFRRLVVGGWELPEFWLATSLSAKLSNGVVVESSIFESEYSGLKAKIKRIMLSRVSTAYCCGKPHKDLMVSLGFRGGIVETGGVGLINPLASERRPQSESYKGRWLYVGRLSEEKGLEELFTYLQSLPEVSLTIVGDGPLCEHLKSVAPENVNFLGYVNNRELSEIYISHDLFVLPSLSETWGLVVEEAMLMGVPVLCSSNVGCGPNLVQGLDVGVRYIVKDEQSFFNSVRELESRYSHYTSNLNLLDFDKIREDQINSYL